MNALTIKKALAGVAIAASSIGFMAAPAFASKNTGGFKRSSEGIKQQYVDPCPGIYNTFAKDVNSAQAAQNAGNATSRDGFLSLAADDLKAGQMAGCDWAAAAHVPTYGAVPSGVAVTRPVRARG